MVGKLILLALVSMALGAHLYRMFAKGKLTRIATKIDVKTSGKVTKKEMAELLDDIRKGLT